MAKKSGVTITIDRLKHFEQALKELSDISIVVGAPEDAKPRDDSKLTNAQIGYIHEHGAPEINLPARPHLKPGVEAVQRQISEQLQLAWDAAMAGKNYMRYVAEAGSVAVKSVRSYIRGRIPPALEPSTLQRKRARGDKRVSTIPLYDTRQYYKSLTWIMRKKGDRAAIRRERDYSGR
jgi:hypothetical protein